MKQVEEITEQTVFEQIPHFEEAHQITDPGSQLQKIKEVIPSFKQWFKETGEAAAFHSFDLIKMVLTQKGYKSSKFHLNYIIIDVTNILSEVGSYICLNTIKMNIKNHYLISISRLLPSFLSDFKTLGLKAFLLMCFYISMKSVSPSSIVIN